VQTTVVAVTFAATAPTTNIAARVRAPITVLRF